MSPDPFPESRTHPSVLLIPETSFGLNRSLRSGLTHGLCAEHSRDIVRDVSSERPWRWSVNSSNQGDEVGPSRVHLLRDCLRLCVCSQVCVRLLIFL